MKWPPIEDNGKTYDLSHLDDKDLNVLLDGSGINLQISFWPHVFCDEKGRGARIRFINDERYFCKARYNESFAVAHHMRQNFVAGHVRVFKKSKRAGNRLETEEQMYQTDLAGVAIFMVIRHVDATSLEVKVISAYPIQDRQTLPRGKLFAARVVLRRKLANQSVL